MNYRGCSTTDGELKWEQKMLQVRCDQPKKGWPQKNSSDHFADNLCLTKVATKQKASNSTNRENDCKLYKQMSYEVKVCRHMRNRNT